MPPPFGSHGASVLHDAAWAQEPAEVTLRPVRFGDEVRRRRKALGLTLEQLAEGSKLSPHYLSTVETGGRDPSLSTVVAIAKGLGAEPGELLGNVKGLTPSAVEAARAFQSLTPDAQETVLHLMRLLRRRR